MGLSIKQRKFIDNYLATGNATEAAKLAGYSERTATEIGSENLTKPNIREAIDMRLRESAMSVDEALRRLADFARADMSAMFEFVDGVKQPYINLTPENLRLVKKIKRDATGKVEIEIEDRQAAIDKLLKVAGAYKDRTEHTGEVVFRVVRE